MTKAEQRKLAGAVQDAYRRLGKGYSIGLGDIGKVFEETALAVADGADLDETMLATLQKYRRRDS